VELLHLRRAAVERVGLLVDVEIVDGGHPAHRPLARRPVRGTRPVVVVAAVAGHLALDRRGRPLQPPPDFGVPQPVPEELGDELPFFFV
jgi:hypothetical protein